MEENLIPNTPESLDPQNPGSFRQLAHKSLDDAIDYMLGIRDSSVLDFLMGSRLIGSYAREG